jgi:plastocyanin
MNRLNWALTLIALMSLIAMTSVASGAHKPVYKWSVDEIVPGAWEAHFVWLQSPYFNYVGKVYWEFDVASNGEVDVLFLDWWGFQNFRDGREYEPMVDPIRGAREGSQGLSGLTTELPYFLILQNPGDADIRVEWVIYADIDWRRWEDQPPGPSLDLRFVEGSPFLALGKSWEMTFSEPGFYRYYCDPHADMTAIIEVIPSDSPGAKVYIDIRDFGFHPEIIRIPQGTTVNWTNLDGVEHSVQVEFLEQGISSDTTSSSPTNTLLVWWPLIVVSGASASGLLLYRRWRSARP